MRSAMNRYLLVLWAAYFLLIPRNVIAESETDEQIRAKLKAKEAAYYKEVNDLEFGRRILDLGGTLCPLELTSDENLHKHGYYVKKLDRVERLYRIGSDIPLPVDAISDFYKNTCSENFKNFYLTNIDSYKKEYKQLRAIQAKYRNVPKRELEMPIMKSDGTIDWEDFKKRLWNPFWKP